MTYGTASATLRFLGKQSEKPLFHTSRPEESRLTADPRVVPIGNAREIDASIAQEGFQLVADSLPALDYTDEPQCNGPYLAAVQRCIARTLGADRVLCDLPVLRLPGGASTQTPLLLVHADFTAESARALMADARVMAKNWSRIMAVHAWRVLSLPPHDTPLALCDVRSVSSDDVRLGDFIEDYVQYGTYSAELRLLRHAPGQLWWNYPDMIPDELLLFLGHDYAGRDGCFHGAYRDLNCPPGVPGRASIETRTFAFFD
jgi:hypothetical protein